MITELFDVIKILRGFVKIDGGQNLIINKILYPFHFLIISLLA